MKICIDCRRVSVSSPCAECRSKRNQARDAIRGTSAQRGYNAEYKRNRELILKDKPYCYWCGRRKATQADHLVPLASGGGNELTNLMPSCAQCNLARTANITRKTNGS